MAQTGVWRQSMKSNAGKTTVGMLVKGVFLWVLVPAGLFFAGYKVIGPRIGQVPSNPLVPSNPENLVSKGSNKTADNPEVETSSGPKPTIDISVDRAGRPRNSESDRPKKKKKKPETQTQAKPANDHTRDEASGDAAMPHEPDPAGGGGG